MKKTVKPGNLSTPAASVPLKDEDALDEPDEPDASEVAEADDEEKPIVSIVELSDTDDFMEEMAPESGEKELNF